MPVGVVAAGIGAVGAIGGAVISSSAQNKASKRAASAAAQNSEANNALQREIYGENKATLSPYSNMGLAAGNALNDLLLGTHTYNAGTASGGAGGGPTSPGTVTPPGALDTWAQGAIDAMAPNITRASTWSHANTITDPAARLDYLLSRSPMGSDQRPLYDAYVAAHGPRPANTPAPAAGGGAGAGAGGGANGAPSSALSAWDTFRNSTNYNWRLGQGNDALTNTWASRGVFDSGAERAAALEYNQNYASNELGNYMDLLARQQATGLSAASAIAGVSNSYAGNISANNTAAANAAANAALAHGQSTANMWGGIASGIGQLGGALAGGFGGGGGFNYGAANSNPGAFAVDLGAAGSTPYMITPNFGL